MELKFNHKIMFALFTQNIYNCTTTTRPAPINRCVQQVCSGSNNFNILLFRSNTGLCRP